LNQSIFLLFLSLSFRFIVAGTHSILLQAERAALHGTDCSRCLGGFKNKSIRPKIDRALCHARDTNGQWLADRWSHCRQVPGRPLAAGRCIVRRHIALLVFTILVIIIIVIIVIIGCRVSKPVFAFRIASAHAPHVDPFFCCLWRACATGAAVPCGRLRPR
jgi:hypothetical protein